VKRHAVLLAALVLIVPLATIGPAAAQTPTAVDFYATLSGDAHTPAVATDATGMAAFSLNAAGTELSYTVVGYGLTGVTASHIHQGAPGTNGPPVAPLFGPDPGATVDGVLARGTIAESDLLSGTMADLVASLRAGTAYVNIHTTAHPSGEIRGQIAGLTPFDGNRFVDDDGNIHEANIEVIAGAGITIGANPPDNDEFDPHGSVTRGQMAAFLNRAFNLPLSTTDRFSDDNGSIFEADINAIAAAGITIGCDPPANTHFCPTRVVTRAEMASFLTRAFDLDATGIDLFGDDDGSVHEANIGALGMAGITVSCNPPDNTSYCPNAPVRREQMATFLARAFGWSQVNPLYAMTFLHNNDGESELLDDGGVGGVARFLTVLDGLRATATATTAGSLLISSGDNFLAGPEFSATLDSGTYYDVRALESFGYDAVQLGNHDFDFGPDVLADFIGAYTTPPTYVSANLDFSGEANLQALVDAGTIAPSTMVTVGGHEIGIVGATTPLLSYISSPRDVVVDPDVAGAIQDQVDTLRAGGAEIVIAISHLQDINEDLALAPELSGVDIMIAGGGDELLANADTPLIPGDETEVAGTYPMWATNADGTRVPVVTTSGQYRYVGNLVATFNAAGRLFNVAASSDPVAVMGQAQDATLKATVEDPVEAYLADLATTVIGTSEVDLDGVRGNVRTMETNEGNLIADALLWQATELAAGFGLGAPDVALQNGGGIRNDSVIPAGDLTELDTFDMLPFSNFVAIVPDIPRAQFKEILENAVSNVEGVDGRFAQIAGFSFSYDPNGTAQVLDADGNVTTPGTRITEVELDGGTMIVTGGAVVAGSDLSVATIDFSARGGDQYPFRDAPITVLGVSYQQALSNYIQAAAVDGGLAGTVTAAAYPVGGEGRITP